MRSVRFGLSKVLGGAAWLVSWASALWLAGCAVPDDFSATDDDVNAGAGYANVPPSPEGCQIPALIQEHCTSCHNHDLVAGAPMPMMSLADMHRPAPSDPGLRVFQMMQRRVHDTVKPMPPRGSLSDSELSLVDRWVAQGGPDCAPAAQPPLPPSYGGAPPGGAGGAPPAVDPPGGWGGAPTPAAGGAPSWGAGGTGLGGSGVGAGGGTVEPGPPALVPEECFELRAHGAQTPGDTTPFQARTGEFYRNFIFKTPYTKPMKGLTFDAIIDNAKVVHHFLLFQKIRGGGVDGTHQDELGIHPDSVLINGWAPGGEPPDMPPGVGMQLPEPGGIFELEIHYFNSTGAPALDRSGIRVCVTSQPVQETATLTWLGTETIGVAPNAEGTAQGTCRPKNPGGGDIHIIASVPHMHQIGSHMKTVINRVGGGVDVLVDEPFSFLDQRTYATPAVVRPGDTLTTTCGFRNTTSGWVLWGPSSTQEMCYNFVLSYPANALANPGASLEGAQNTCLW